MAVIEASESKKTIAEISRVGWAPVQYWATIGAVILAFQVYVLARWITGPNFVATPPGDDPLAPWQPAYFLALQIVIPIIAIFMFWYWIIRPWLKTRTISTDGRALGAFSMIFFWDMGMNYSSTVLYYNSHFFNRGAWSLGSWPSWFSPNANVLPEPILITVPGYTALVFSQALFILWILRKLKARFPEMGVGMKILAIIVGLTIVDSIIEIALIRTGVYAYPGAIHAVTLFAGETYQFPLTEGFLFGGLGIGVTAMLLYFKDDKGLTWAERGVEKLKISPRRKGWLQFFALFGFIHLSFFAFYTIPNQWISVNTDPFPQGYPDYLENGLCVYGVNGDECPGPGVMIPRPPHKDGG